MQFKITSYVLIRTANVSYIKTICLSRLLLLFVYVRPSRGRMSFTKSYGAVVFNITCFIDIILILLSML